MLPDQPDKVWISREEYDRLRTAEQATPAPNVVSSNFYADGQEVSQPPKYSQQQIWVGFILSCALLVALVVGNSAIAIPVLAIFFLYGLVTLISYANSRMHHQPNPKSITAKSPLKILAIVTAIVLLTPVLAFAALLTLFLVVVQANGGQSS